MPQDPTYNHHTMMRMKERFSRSNPPYVPRANSRLSTLLQKMFDHYTGVFDEPHPASEFDNLYDQHSPPTVGKAKKLLGIRSVRRDGLWWWTTPTRTPAAALDRHTEQAQLKSNKVKPLLQHLSRSSVKMMQDLMKDVNYCGSNIDIESGMRAAGYGRSTIMHAKRDLGIASIYSGGAWLWVQVGEDVVEWLHEQLVGGPRLLKDLTSIAPWHSEVIKLCCLQPRGFMLRLSRAGYEVVDLNYYAKQPIPTASASPQDESAVIDDDSEVEEWL